MIFVFLFFVGLLRAQAPVQIYISTVVPIGACNPRSFPVLNPTTGALYVCKAGTWANIAGGGGGGGGVPGGANCAVQFNNSGAFGGDAVNLCWDNALKNLGIGVSPIALSASVGNVAIAGTLRVFKDFNNIGGQGAIYLSNDASNPYLGYGQLVSSWSFGDSVQTWLRLNKLTVGGMQPVVVVPSATGHCWTSVGDASNVPDTCFARNAAGLVEINNATAGTFRDLKLRNLISTSLSGSGTRCVNTDNTGLLGLAGGNCSTGTIVTTNNALTGDGAGNAVAAIGTGSNCVHVDGTSAACGGGGSITVTKITGNPAVDVTNTTTETTLWSVPIGANSLGATGQLRASLMMLLKNNAGGQTITFRVKFGATTLVTHTIANGASANYNTAQLIIELSNLNATNAQFTMSSYIQGQGTTSGNDSSVLAAFYRLGMNNTSTVDTTMSQNFVVTAQWTNMNTNLDLQFYDGRLEQY